MRTFTKILMTFGLFAFLMSSCGSSEICSCVEAQLSMAKEMKTAKDDTDKAKAIRDKYKDQREK